MKRAVNPRRSVALGLKTCQKDQMKRPSGLHYGDQLDADSLAGDEEPEFKIGIKYIYYRTLCLNGISHWQSVLFRLARHSRLSSSFWENDPSITTSLLDLVDSCLLLFGCCPS